MLEPGLGPEVEWVRFPGLPSHPQFNLAQAQMSGPGSVIAFEVRGGALYPVVGRPSQLIGVPFDRPVVGYGGKTINTLRLWAAAAHDYFNFQEFSSGDFVGALTETLGAESLTRVLYPDDHTTMGQGLRFVQEYFLVALRRSWRMRRWAARQEGTA